MKINKIMKQYYMVRIDGIKIPSTSPVPLAKKTHNIQKNTLYTKVFFWGTNLVCILLIITSIFTTDKLSVHLTGLSRKYNVNKNIEESFSHLLVKIQGTKIFNSGEIK